MHYENPISSSPTPTPAVSGLGIRVSASGFMFRVCSFFFINLQSLKKWPTTNHAPCFGFQVSGSEIWVSVVGFQVAGCIYQAPGYEPSGVPGSGVRVQPFGFRAFRSSFFFSAACCAFRDSGLGFRVSIFGFREPVLHFGKRVSGLGVREAPGAPPARPRPPIPATFGIFVET